MFVYVIIPGWCVYGEARLIVAVAYQNFIMKPSVQSTGLQMLVTYGEADPQEYGLNYAVMMNSGASRVSPC